MARGRGGYSSNVVLVSTKPSERSRRAMSMPASAHLSFEPLASDHARRVSNAMWDDSDTMTAASRRQDQRLLDNATSRLANMPYKHPATAVYSSSDTRQGRSTYRSPSPLQRAHVTGPSVQYVHYYPRASSRRAVSEFPADRLVLSASSARPRSTLGYRDIEVEGYLDGHQSRAARMASRSHHDFDVDSHVDHRPLHRPYRSRYDLDDVDAYLDSRTPYVPRRYPAFPTFSTPGLPKSYFESKRKRSQSVPPEVLRGGYTYKKSSDADNFIDKKSPLLITADHFFQPLGTQVLSPSRSCLDILEPPRAPRASYYPKKPLAPLPSTSLSYFRAGSEPPVAHRKQSNHSANLAVRNARACIGRIERELGYNDYEVDEPIIAPVRPVQVTRASRCGGNRSTLPPRHLPPPAPRRRLAEIEAQIEMATPVDYNDYQHYSPRPNVANLRNRYSSARSKMDQQKTLLDRYLPLDLTPPMDVKYEVAHKYGELADRVARMPSLQPYRPARSRASSLPPPSYGSGSSGARGLSEHARTPLRETFRPSMSDTRKRCRDVLCRSKRDPHYFD